MKQSKELKIKGETVVYIDYANVYGWHSSLKKPINLKKLFKYLKTYPKIQSINFYYGKDSHKKSREFLTKIKKIGYQLTTKPVKYITVGKVGETVITKRKCDFDIEICMSVYSYIEKAYSGFIFFTGDGDFEPLYKYLIKLKKQVIVVYQKGHLGKEIWELKKGIFKTEIKNFPVF